MALEQTEFVRIVDENARRLLSLINDLLTLSGIEGHRMLLRPEPTDLRPLIERYVLDLEVAAAEKGLNLSVLLPARLVFQVDPERIGQVVTNLVANAVKFTEPGGDVRVELRREAGQAVLSVADTGIGIPPRTATACPSGSSARATPPTRPSPAPGSGLPSARASSMPTAGTSSPRARRVGAQLCAPTCR
jgi:two-component system, cell cycle sensor histidine kinase PleC